MVSTRGHVLVLGVDPFAEVRYTGFTDGDCLWDVSLGQHTGDGKFDGETFLGRLLIFFLGGRGRRRGGVRASTAELFSQDDTRFQTDPFFMLYVIYCVVEVSLMYASGHREKCPRPRCPGQTRVMFKLRQPVDLFLTLKTVKGLLYLVPPRTPRNSGYGVLCTCGLCYMLFLLYV
jgi:hypothetical protein